MADNQRQLPLEKRNPNHKNEPSTITIAGEDL